MMRRSRTAHGSGRRWYFFAYGHDYKAGLRDYSTVRRSAPLIPRWILGNWWSLVA
ncbi:MAG: hypothetical protein IPK17_00445 [Chloroflexi bacterium]|uniref:hypothetical protein n=1 Tax=Candidatus Flexifilum breve TaxID=3140694 RepID=UPI003135E365|nr:hypothetical protein [Chloroflexota bacterium]